MPLGHGNPDASIAYYGKKNRPRKNGIHTGKSGPRRLSFALVRLALPNRIRIVGQAFLLAAGIQIRQAGALGLQVKEWAAANVWLPARRIRDIILRLHPTPAEDTVASEGNAARR